MSKTTVLSPTTWNSWIPKWRGAIAFLTLTLLAGLLPAAARQSATSPATIPATTARPAAAKAKPAKHSTAVRRRVRRVRHIAARRRTVVYHAVGHHRVVRHARVRVAARRTVIRRRYVRHYVRPARYYPARLNPTAGDFTAFDDPVVRRAAVAALGPYYGSVVALDPNNGRILSIVNQKLAFSSGFEPCSTIKPVIALAALQQGLITGRTMLRVGRYESLDLTEAIAHSNNEFFAELGQRLGFDVVSRYAHMLGLGEPAGWGIREEQSGTFPSAPPPAYRGGIGKMTSFGESIRITPLQLAAMMSVFANGGSLYYLQYPRTQEQVKDFAPRLKRRIDLGPHEEDIREGMLGAVEFGTARESYTPDGEMVYAKTGTCTDETRGGEIGWFVSYASPDVLRNHPQIVLVVLLRRYGYHVSGPEAAHIGGRIYRQLYLQNFFSAENGGTAGSSLASR
ncbi:MAG TPA: penicillin-binding transpeptidase domain-containing protein [Candidatus Dormibacteraeota bacterium]|nr:penicillin-binding transpeptidase domain-containing protein [Candidatus Dormibacteraeota bacterium]